MGNEKSIPAGLRIEEEIVDITDYWIQKMATINNGATKICIFESCTSDKNDNILMGKFSKNLMLHRHPHILKYISSWSKGGKLYIATEAAKPLRQVINYQPPLQLCVGLYNILKAIVFLHEKASSSHNNLCKDIIYVTSDGSWKLGRMEYLCRFCDLTTNYLTETRVHRYKPAVNPKECDALPNPLTTIDQYAFSVLVHEILEGKTNDDIPTVSEFKEFCKTHLQGKNSVSTSQSTLSQLMSHPFFTHRFIAIYSFLADLPLKNDSEKNNFFKTLADELTIFPEELIASHLVVLLLSRIVLLDKTAQDLLIPRILNVKSEEYPSALFTDSVARKYVSPRLLNVFCIRDSQTRLILLKHFVPLCRNFFTNEELRRHILPELLVGVKDTNDTLVEATLRALADLIPILGASIVIGKDRARLFADGRPVICKSDLKLKTVNEGNTILLSTELPNLNDLSLLERPSPDGGEDFTDEIPTNEENESWVDWDDHESVPMTHMSQDGKNLLLDNCVSSNGTRPIINEEPTEQKNNIQLPKKLEKSCLVPIQDDILSLDIKCSKVIKELDDIDEMFKDMEPVISKPKILNISEDCPKTKFQVILDDNSNCNGWGEEWGDVEDTEEVNQ